MEVWGPYKWPIINGFPWGYFTAINGVISLLITDDGAHLVHVPPCTCLFDFSCDALDFINCCSEKNLGEKAMCWSIRHWIWDWAVSAFFYGRNRTICFDVFGCWLPLFHGCLKWFFHVKKAHVIDTFIGTVPLQDLATCLRSRDSSSTQTASLVSSLVAGDKYMLESFMWNVCKWMNWSDVNWGHLPQKRKWWNKTAWYRNLTLR